MKYKYNIDDSIHFLYYRQLKVGTIISQHYRPMKKEKWYRIEDNDSSSIYKRTEQQLKEAERLYQRS